MTDKQRLTLGKMARAEDGATIVDVLERAALRAALADLDACRKAIWSVYDELNNNNHPHEPNVESCTRQLGAFLEMMGEKLP